MLARVVQVGPVETVAFAQRPEEGERGREPRGILEGEHSHERA